ncbi:preprotein translocase subunit SecG [Ollibium composti]|uniref:Protein-export membrane protein SecG n=1 Tax=Ollibium composti TaxID=2675109 RepID=A0ABY2QCV9_9HYPH|nr:preprotein translocase subunit SecG [Mesorhizobium composti]THF59986.1 preprotein translocase subunit SecG [Mesorhizobium composti]
METVLIVVHLMVVLALVGVVLLQRSEGGGLGIGGGSGFMTARGAANALTRATAILATIFFATSLILSMVARYGEKPIDILDRLPAASQDGSGQSSGGQNGGGKGVLDQLPGSTAPAAPANQTTPPTDGGSATTAPAPAAPAEPQANAPTMAPQAPAAPASEAPANDGGAMKPAAPQVPNQ